MTQICLIVPLGETGLSPGHDLPSGGHPSHPIAGTPGHPSHPIAGAPPTPTHPISGPPTYPAHPWVPPSPGVPAHPISGGGTPSHPIYVPVYPAHPWVPPSGAPSHPIYIPGVPAHPIAPGEPPTAEKPEESAWVYAYVPDYGFLWLEVVSVSKDQPAQPAQPK
jgi:hypothetical protein